MKKALKILGWTAFVIVLLLGLVMALSPVAKYVINRYGDQLIGRELHAEQVFINPFWGGVTVKGFECKEANGETNFVAFDRLYVQIAWPHLMAKHVTLRHIHLDGFSGQILKSNDRLNFSDIIERFASDEKEPADTTKSDWTIHLRDIRIENSAIRYRDVISGKQWNVDDISLAIPGLYFDNTQTNAGLEFALPTGGRVGIQAGYKMQANRYSVRLNLYDVHTDVALPLVQDFMEVSGLGAVINGQVHVDGSLDNVTHVQMKGGLSIRGLSVRDKHKDEVAAFDELRVVVNRGDVANNTYILDSLVIDGLTGSYEVHDNWNTLSRLMKSKDKAEDDEKEEEQPAEPAPAKASKPMVWMAKTVVITGHDLTYSDYSMKHDWQYAIKSLRVDGSNVASNGRNSVKLKATLTHDAQLNADYVGGLDLKTQDSRLNLKLFGVQLSDFSALCRNYTGYPLESGVLALESHMDVTGGKLKGTNKVVINQPKVGKKERFSKAKYKNIPVKTGFSLLTSAQNMIVLDVPVAGDVNNPKFKLAKVIGRAVLKVFFGPLMGVNDKRQAFTEDELREMEDLLGEDAVSLSQDSVALGEDSVASPASDSLPLTETDE